VAMKSLFLLILGTDIWCGARATSQARPSRVSPGSSQPMRRPPAFPAVHPPQSYSGRTGKRAPSPASSSHGRRRRSHQSVRRFGELESSSWAAPGRENTGASQRMENLRQVVRGHVQGFADLVRSSGPGLARDEKDGAQRVFCGLGDQACSLRKGEDLFFMLISWNGASTQGWPVIDGPKWRPHLPDPKWASGQPQW
jgi:hypothetical protein